MPKIWFISASCSFSTPFSSIWMVVASAFANCCIFSNRSGSMFSESFSSWLKKMSSIWSSTSDCSPIGRFFL